MVDKRLLDTDTVIEFFRKNPVVADRVAGYLEHHERLSIAIITYYEVLRGLKYLMVDKQLRAFENFAADSEILPVDLDAARKAAEVYAGLRKQGQLISEADILIAGVALVNNCILVTNNTAHFSRVPNLQIENWIA